MLKVGGEIKMPEYPNELQKLMAISIDQDLAGDLRTKAIEQIGNFGTHQALLVLLELVANDKIAYYDRDLALKQAREILKLAR